MKSTKFVGTLLMFASCVFCFAETRFFGGNFSPQTDAEIFADCFSLIIFGAGFYLRMQKEFEK